MFTNRAPQASDALVYTNVLTGSDVNRFAVMMEIMETKVWESKLGRN